MKLLSYGSFLHDDGYWYQFKRYQGNVVHIFLNGVEVEDDFHGPWPVRDWYWKHVGVREEEE